MAGTHSRFGMSKAAVWSNCKGALALIEAAKLPPETPTIHAASGTCTHSLAERYAKGQDILQLIGTKETHDGHEIRVDMDRVSRAIEYVDAVKARGGEQLFENKLSTSPVVLVDEQFSTADAIVMHFDTLTLEVHDLKDGNGLVSAVDNEQLIGYLLAAMYAMEELFMVKFENFLGAIHQPKIDWYSEHTYTRAKLLEWQEKFRASARRGSDLIGESANRIDAALTPGDWCEKGWCPARSWCKARERAVVAQFPDLTLPIAPMLTNEQLGQLLAKRKLIEDAFESWAMEAWVRASRGEHIPGQKMVQGRQGPRKWSGDETAISDKLFEDLEHATWERTLISPTTAEKLLKKKHPMTWESLQANIVREPGKMTLVPDIDNRTPLSLAAAEFGSVDDAADLIGDLQ